jgi:predicted TPR repeat methyltransferase
MTKRKIFDKPYYDHFYGRSRHRIASRDEENALCDFLCAYLKYLKQPVRSVVDIGCGFGFWRDRFAEHFPAARYTGVEISEYLCEEYGWTQSSVVNFRSQKPFDLVVCKDTLQYLSPKDAEAAIENLAKLCRGALYFNLLTTEDWDDNCDQSLTDADVYVRPANWYRKRLQRHMTNIGGGLFLSQRSPSVVWEMEKFGG